MDHCHLTSVRMWGDDDPPSIGKWSNFRKDVPIPMAMYSSYVSSPRGLGELGKCTRDLSKTPFSVGDEFFEVVGVFGPTHIWSNSIFYKEHVIDFRHDYRNRAQLIKGALFILQVKRI